jgi:hypothetical protein
MDKNPINCPVIEPLIAIKAYRGFPKRKDLVEYILEGPKGNVARKP